MFNVSIVGQRLSDGVPFCAIIHEECLDCALRAFIEEFPDCRILSFHACFIQGGKHETRFREIKCNHS